MPVPPHLMPRRYRLHARPARGPRPAETVDLLQHLLGTLWAIRVGETTDTLSGVPGAAWCSLDRALLAHADTILRLAFEDAEIGRERITVTLPGRPGTGRARRVVLDRVSGRWHVEGRGRASGRGLVSFLHHCWHPPGGLPVPEAAVARFLLMLLGVAALDLFPAARSGTLQGAFR